MRDGGRWSSISREEGSGRRCPCPANCRWWDSEGSRASSAAPPNGSGGSLAGGTHWNHCSWQWQERNLSLVELRGDGGVEVAGGEGTEEERAGGLEVVRRVAGGGVGEGEGR